MSIWIARSREALQTQLWPVPALAVLAALLLGLWLPELEASFDAEISPQAGQWIFGGDAAAARSLLGTIAQSLITVTSLTFSLTVVTLQLASSQFSPRLLRTFTQDRFVQMTLALFLATFTYALTVLRAVRGADDAQISFVPKVSVTVAFGLAILSVLGLVLFLAHLARQIRVETMLQSVRRDATRAMEVLLTPRGEADATEDAPVPPPDAANLLASDDGFVTRLDRDDLREIAGAESVVLVIDSEPGAFVVSQTPIGVVWPSAGGVLSAEALERIRQRVAPCVHTGVERTLTQDVGFGVRQLTDVATKALSPGINDPTTAVHALGHLSALLCALVDRELGPELLRDDQGRVRVVVSRPGLADYVEVALGQPRHYGAADVQVLAKIFQVLLELGHRVPPQDRAVVRDQLERLRGTVAAQAFGPTDRATLEALGDRVERCLQSSSAGR